MTKKINKQILRNTILRLTSIVSALLIFAVVLTGCGNKLTEADVSYAGPMAENVLTAIEDNNYDQFSKDFSDKMKNTLTKENFEAMVELFDSKIGEYQGKSFAGAANTKEDGKILTVIVYQAEYSREPKGVQITVSFSGNNDQKIIEGLFFNSPNLAK